MSAVISATGLTKRFRRTEAVDGLNLEVSEGSIFGLIGPNGAGKTTTIKILMNIHKATAQGARTCWESTRDASALRNSQRSAMSPRARRWRSG